MEIRKNKKEEMRESAGWERSNAGKNQAFSAGGDRVARAFQRGARGALAFSAPRAAGARKPRAVRRGRVQFSAAKEMGCHTS